MRGTGGGTAVKSGEGGAAARTGWGADVWSGAATVYVVGIFFIGGGGGGDGIFEFFFHFFFGGGVLVDTVRLGVGIYGENRVGNELRYGMRHECGHLYRPHPFGNLFCKILIKSSINLFRGN